MPNAHGSDGRSGQAGVVGLDRAEVLGRVCLGLADRRYLDGGPYGYARVVAGDLVELLVVHRGDGRVYLDDAEVARLGEGDLRAAALENLLAAPLGRAKVIEWPYGIRLHEVWHADWGHTASKLLVLRDVLRRVVGTDDFPHGVLVVVPTHYELVFLPIEVCQHLGAAGALAAYAGQGRADDPGALTSDVFWWRDGALRTVLAADGGGLDQGFVDMLTRLAELELEAEPGARP
jgi:hypothetical protein